MKLADMKPNIVYARSASGYRMPSFFLTGDPLFTVESRKRSRGYHLDPVRQVKVVRAREVRLTHTGELVIDPCPFEVLLAQVDYEVGTVEEFVEREGKNQAARERQRADRERLQRLAKALAEHLKAKGVSSYPHMDGLRIIDLDGLAALLGVTEETSDASA